MDRPPVAFLLAQVGAHAAARFSERLRSLRLLPAHSGILWHLAYSPEITQKRLAARLRILPSRLVGLLDEMESRGLVERGRNPDDRRRHSLRLTAKGRSTLAAIGALTREHQSLLLAALSEADKEHLARILQRIADEQGLTHGVHPGYATLPRPPRK